MNTPGFYDLVDYPRVGTHATKKEWINAVILLNGLELAAINSDKWQNAVPWGEKHGNQGIEVIKIKNVG